MDLIKAKIEQALGILDELDIDMWLIFCRESDMMADPSFPLVVGNKIVWQSAFFYCRSGETIAMVGNYDAADFEKSGCFNEVIPYVKDCGAEIKKIVQKHKPGKIALNYSINDPSADGLTHGMFELLNRYLKGTVYTKRFISSEQLVSLLRGRKTKQELDRITKAVQHANQMWKKSLKSIKPGMTEIQIARLIESNLEKNGITIAFETIVNAGSKTSPGHGMPSEAVLEPGDLLHIDFGAKYKDYCSDLQRLAYVRRSGEDTPPPELLAAFDMVKEVIEKSVKIYRPGTKGYRIDAAARKILRDNGYPVYQHALGHQLGRSVHDGAGLVGPKWKRYGTSPEIPLEKNNVFTAELGIEVKNIGYVGLEEDLVVKEEGGEFLCTPQTKLEII
jgi:Xaa-Pro aminopeptidase